MNIEEIKAKIALIASQGYRDGSSVTKGFTYHNIPFDEFAGPAHKDISKEFIEILSNYGDPANKSVLEIGCANGYYTFNLAKLGASEIVAYEADTLVWDVNESIRVLKEIENIKFINKKFNEVDIAEHALQDKVFDLCLMLNVHMWIVKQVGFERSIYLMDALSRICKTMYFQTSHKESAGMFVVRELGTVDDVKDYLEVCNFDPVLIRVNRSHDGKPRALFRCASKSAGVGV